MILFSCDHVLELPYVIMTRPGIGMLGLFFGVYCCDAEDSTWETSLNASAIPLGKSTKLGFGARLTLAIALRRAAGHSCSDHRDAVSRPSARPKISIMLIARMAS